MQENINFSPGILVILWRVIFLLSKNEAIPIRDIIKICNSLGILGGTIPIKQAIKLGQILQYFEIQNETVSLTEECKHNVLILCQDEDPNNEVIKKIIYKIILRNKFPWLLFFDEDVETFKIAIPKVWIDILASGGLLNFNNADVQAWWKALVSKFHEYDLANTKQIGEIGEILTIEFEKARIQKHGISSPDSYVKWVSKFSDAYGYDVISINCNINKPQKKPKSTIFIEVKSTVLTDESNFIFRLTRNEWDTALRNIDSYYIYCWVGINTNKKASKSGPFIIPIKGIAGLVPNDNSVFCSWTECKLEIDLHKYAFVIN